MRQFAMFACILAAASALPMIIGEKKPDICCQCTVSEDGEKKEIKKGCDGTISITSRGSTGVIGSQLGSAAIMVPAVQIQVPQMPLLQPLQLSASMNLLPQQQTIFSLQPQTTFLTVQEPKVSTQCCTVCFLLHSIYKDFFFTAQFAFRIEFMFVFVVSKLKLNE
ncbi:unnamed protein product [Gongylonema pulchrum]|uniref:Uncharacterized protein n=1 Tax=Gongylonema pulchrum TaxID=637853 RepID=A0A183DFW0_9BILA|nr:unnamed protein product [Gongylonema pulchrum]